MGKRKQKVNKIGDNPLRPGKGGGWLLTRHKYELASPPRAGCPDTKEKWLFFFWEKKGRERPCWDAGGTWVPPLRLLLLRRAAAARAGVVTLPSCERARMCAIVYRQVHPYSESPLLLHTPRKFIPACHLATKNGLAEAYTERENRRGRTEFSFPPAGQLEGTGVPRTCPPGKGGSSRSPHLKNTF